MSWELKPALSAFPAFAAEWDRLNAELYAGHPMFDSRFIGPLLDHFGKGDELLCVHRTGDACDGAMILHPLGLGRWALFLPSQMQAGALMFKDAQLVETLLPALPSYAWSLDLLCIDPLYSPDWTHLRLPRIVMPHANTMAVSTHGGFDAYWNGRSKNLIHNLRRYRRRAESTVGPLTLEIFKSPEEIVPALARYGQLESSGWKGKQGTAIAPDNTQGKFYADVLTRLAATGQAFVMELRAGERLLASRLFICSNEMWICLKTTYDETQSAFAPGRLLLHDMIEQACADIPEGVVEFYTNATHDQAAWATRLRPIPHHQILRNDTLAGIYGIAKSLRSRVAQQHATKFDPLTISRYSNVADLPPSARQLFEHAESEYPEFSAGWFENLQRTVFGGDSSVRYYVAERAGHPVAILPVRLARYGLTRRVEALGNYYTSLYSPILTADVSEVELAALLQAASQDHGGAQEVRFAPMDPESPVFAALLAALRSIGWIPFRYFCFGNWHQPITQAWIDYLAARPGELRSTIKRKGKKFAADGGTLEILTNPADIVTAITDYTFVYSRSWKKPEPYPEFIPGLIRWLAGQGWLRLGIARLNGQPISVQLWIVSHGRANIFKLAYDEVFAKYAAGTLLTAHLMEHVIDRDQVREIDYLIGDDKYKKHWMTHRRERWGIAAYHPTSIIGLGLLVGSVLTHVQKRLQSVASRRVVMVRG